MRGAAPTLLLAIAGTLLAACLPIGEPCCEGDLDCGDGLSCFEGRCAARCDDEAELADAQCAEGELCVVGAGVCRATDPDVQLERCPYGDRDQAP